MVTSTIPSDSSEPTESPDLPPKQAVSWRQFLLRDYQRSDDDPSLKEDFFWSMVLVLGWCVVIVVVTTTLVNNWPENTHMYKSDDPVPEEGYICACSLPATLQEPENPADSQGTLNFNECYSRGSLETISVLQYATNNTDIDATVLKYNTTNVLYRTTEGGYVVSQVAHELSIGATKVTKELTLLYRNDEKGIADKDIWFPLDGYVLSAQFMSFPESYVRMTFRYSCKDCELCGLSIINGYIDKATGKREKWGLCYYYARDDAGQCNQTNMGFTYEGKCVLYPTRKLPFAFALKSFINELLENTGIINVLPVDTRNQDFFNYSSVQPNVLYVNSSSVTRGVLQHGFVEYPKGSTLRAWLLNNLPSSDTPCSAIPDLRYSESSDICNGTSICNAFVDADQSIELKCQDMRDDSACRNIVRENFLTVDNKYKSSVKVGPETICPQFSCVSNSSDAGPVPAYRVTRTFAVNTVDPINEYLNSSTLSRDWLRMSGICTNTYDQVYRFNDTMFLQANCTNGTDLCKLTGQVYRLDDYFRDDRQFNSFDSKSGELFVCSRVTEQSWPLWFLNYVNVLFSWLSVLIFLYLSGVYKLVRFLRARYFKTDSPNNNQTTSLDGDHSHPTNARGLSSETSEQQLVTLSGLTQPGQYDDTESELLFTTPCSS